MYTTSYCCIVLSLVQCARFNVIIVYAYGEMYASIYECAKCYIMLCLNI